MIFLHVHSQQRYSFLRHLPAISFLRIVVGILMYSIVAGGCATNKEKAGEVKYDMMESLTARFNIIYHGRKIIEDVTRQNFEAHRDNYQQLLPVLIEPTDITASSNSQLMDSVIGKAWDIINKKSKSSYIDEAYLLIGKANHLKGNYYNAVEFFTYVANTFIAAPRHRQAALVWKARSQMQLGNLTDAGLVLDTVFANLEPERESVGLAFATQAKYYLLVHDEVSAITMLEQAIEHTRHKPAKLRWHFLLGQLLQKHGRAEEADGHYSRVMRSNAPYEMSFHAGLNRVFLATAENASSEQRVRLLRRMLSDGKNSDFKDQIYFQIATVFYADGYLPEALANYELALRQESANRYQTTLTYLKLADHYFNIADYSAAKQYYDSVGMILPADFPNVGEVQRKIANLDELIAQLQVVAYQDSLQYLARLDTTRRHLEVDRIIAGRWAEIKTNEQASKEPKKKKLSQTLHVSPFDDVLGEASAYADGRFYFNNPDAMGMGQAEFRRRWGNRQLQDNWRFNDMAGSGTVEVATRDSIQIEGALPEVTAGVDSAAWAAGQWHAFMEEIPDTEVKMEASDALIREALMRIGDSYRDELLDNVAAIRTYEELLKRYPSVADVPLLYYNLYRLYADIDAINAAFYREKLLGEFPDSRYSHIVRDPMYLAKLEHQQRVLDQAYESIYMLYTERQYQQVIEEVTPILNQGKGRRQTLSQLAYLRALAWGKISTLDTFENALQQLVADFPDDSLITPLVGQHLSFIGEHRNTLSTREYALQAMDEGRERFVDEPTITLWPELVIMRGPEPPKLRGELTVTVAERAGMAGLRKFEEAQVVVRPQSTSGITVGGISPNIYRDLELLPDSGTYYFVINVMNGRVNLAPSRFGIGQFNRTRYNGQAITHQLKAVSDENQLVYIGPFNSYDDAKRYETRIMPLIPDIMKIPGELYNTFVITATNFGTLSDFDDVDDYHAVYQEQQER